MRARVLTFTISLLLAAVALPALARNPWDGQPPYGKSLMSKQERRTYIKTMQELPTVEEQEAYWRAHIEKMQQRALERGVALRRPPRMRSPGQEILRPVRAPYMAEVMTSEEVETYYEEVAALKDRTERMAYITAHIEKMQALASERGFSAPDTIFYSDTVQVKEKALGASARANDGDEPKSGSE